MGNDIATPASPASASPKTIAPIDFGKLEQCVDEATCRSVERLLYREARLLDGEQFSEWLEKVVDPAIRYVVVSRELRYRKERRYGGPAEMYMFNDDFKFLSSRVEQFNSGMQWRTDPPERFRRLVTNIETFLNGNSNELVVRSNVLIQRSRRAYEIDQFTYCREDLLRRDAAGGLRLAQRRVDFDERSVSGRNLLVFL